MKMMSLPRSTQTMKAEDRHEHGSVKQVAVDLNMLHSHKLIEVETQVQPKKIRSRRMLVGQFAETHAESSRTLQIHEV